MAKIGPFTWRLQETYYNDAAFLAGGLISTATLSVALSTLAVLVFRHKHHCGMVKSGLLGTAIGLGTPISAWVLGGGVAIGLKTFADTRDVDFTMTVGPFEWDRNGVVNDGCFFYGAVVAGFGMVVTMTTLAALVFRHKHHWSALKAGLMGITIGTIATPLTIGVIGLGTAIGTRYTIQAFTKKD